MYRKGDRVELVKSLDPKLRPGMHGTVKVVTERGVVLVDWDKGETIGVILGKDFIRKVL